MGKISEGDTEFPYTTKISATKRSRKNCLSWHYSLKIIFIAALFILILFIDKHVFAHAHTHIYIYISLYNHLRTCTNSIEMSMYS